MGEHIARFSLPQESQGQELVQIHRQRGLPLPNLSNPRLSQLRGVRFQATVKFGQLLVEIRFVIPAVVIEELRQAAAVRIIGCLARFPAALLLHHRDPLGEVIVVQNNKIDCRSPLVCQSTLLIVHHINAIVEDMFFLGLLILFRLVLGKKPRRNHGVRLFAQPLHPAGGVPSIAEAGRVLLLLVLYGCDVGVHDDGRRPAGLQPGPGRSLPPPTPRAPRRHRPSVVGWWYESC